MAATVDQPLEISFQMRPAPLSAWLDWSHRSSASAARSARSCCLWRNC
jgi:hypothetical protein